MKAFKQLAVSTLLGLGLGLTAGALQAVHADTASAYLKVLAAARVAAQEAFAAKMTGSTATCYIAEKARKASINAGIDPKTPDYQAVVARSTYQAAKETKIAKLLKNEVVLVCSPMTKAVNGRLPSAVVVGGTALAIIGIASTVDSSSGSTSGRPISP